MGLPGGPGRPRRAWSWAGARAPQVPTWLDRWPRRPRQPGHRSCGFSSICRDLGVPNVASASGAAQQLAVDDYRRSDLGADLTKSTMAARIDPTLLTRPADWALPSTARRRVVTEQMITNRIVSQPGMVIERAIRQWAMSTGPGRPSATPRSVSHWRPECFSSKSSSVVTVGGGVGPFSIKLSIVPSITSPAAVLTARRPWLARGRLQAR